MLGVGLFARAGRRGGLSAAGRNLLPQARQVVSGAERLLGQGRQLAGGAEPLLRLLVDELFPFERLTDALTASRAAAGATRLRIDQAPLRDVVAGIVDGDGDLGFTLGTPNIRNAGLESRPLGRVTMVPVAAPSHPLAETDEPIDRQRASGQRQIVLSERLQHAVASEDGVFAADTWRVGDIRIKHDLLTSGLGWGSMPEHLVAGDIAAGRLRRLVLEFTADAVLPLIVVWRPATPLGPNARDLLERVATEGTSPGIS